MASGVLLAGPTENASANDPAEEIYNSILKKLSNKLSNWNLLIKTKGHQGKDLSNFLNELKVFPTPDKLSPEQLSYMGAQLDNWLLDMNSACDCGFCPIFEPAIRNGWTGLMGPENATIRTQKHQEEDSKNQEFFNDFASRISSYGPDIKIKWIPDPSTYAQATISFYSDSLYSEPEGANAERPEWGYQASQVIKLSHDIAAPCQTNAPDNHGYEGFVQKVRDKAKATEEWKSLDPEIGKLLTLYQAEAAETIWSLYLGKVLPRSNGEDGNLDEQATHAREDKDQARQDAIEQYTQFAKMAPEYRSFVDAKLSNLKNNTDTHSRKFYEECSCE